MFILILLCLIVPLLTGIYAIIDLEKLVIMYKIFKFWTTAKNLKSKKVKKIITKKTLKNRNYVTNIYKA